MEKIILPERHKKTLADHAGSKMPNESCAILFGSTGGGRTAVSDVFLTENVDESPRSFAVPSGELIRAYGVAEEKKTCVVGIFHSHPDSEAYPSGTDMEFMRINPVVWVIYSGVDGGFRAFVLDGGVREIQVEWTGTS